MVAPLATMSLERRAWMAGAGMAGGSAFHRLLYKVLNAVVAQSAVRRAWPLVLAAADPSAEPGAYYGPTAFGGARGKVGKATVADSARAAELMIGTLKMDHNDA